MSGRLYDLVTSALAPSGVTVEEYIAEMRRDGANWSQIAGCIRADTQLFDAGPTSATVKRWASGTHERVAVVVPTIDGRQDILR